MSEKPGSSHLPSNQETFAGETAAPVSTPSFQPPVIQIEGYRILNEISRGGQAVVFCAIFLKTGRKVAVKVMREGPLATEAGRGRFTREAQILASLNHPNIVTILDRGQTADGSDYFTMDYIDGQSLDDATWKLPDYMQHQNPDPSAPLKLFLKICDAVNAAHLRGIVHRDLKPSNIRMDERGEPHVLDFGLARGSMSEELPSSSEPVTITGQFLGSLPWASPEQAEGIGQKIDMRSDVYSLGVILYQLVTGGTFPYQVVGSMRDVLNNIITAQPPAPSQILSQRESRDVARRIKRAKVKDNLINPALDAIILKSLAKRRDDRYQSAGELARDIEAYLAGRPLQAGIAMPATRNRLTIMTATAAVAMMLIIIGILVITLKGNRKTENESQIDRNNPESTQFASVAQPPVPPMVAKSPLKQEYQDLEKILNRFKPIGYFIRTNAPSRYSTWLAEAEKGDAVGQLLVSRCYEFGEAVARNPEEANRYMQMAIQQKLPMALCLAGNRLRASLPPIQNFSEAIKWYNLAAEEGSARAMLDLGIMHSRGQGTAVDVPLAIKYLEKSASLGAPAAYAMLGDIYRTPNNNVTDVPRAISLYRKSIELGAPYGCLPLGQMYANGNGVQQDFAEALRLFLRAENEGVFGASENIGDLYFAGRGVKEDKSEASRWYQKAVTANSVSAMRKLAAMYEKGEGVTTDLNQAATLYAKAANAGDIESRKWIAENNSFVH